MRNFLLFLCILTACSTSIPTTEIPSVAEAERLETGSKSFPIPDKIRGRVAFWASVYSKYGEFHRVVHHRMYPQAVFTVLDFYDAAKRMSASELTRHIENTELQMKNKIQGALESFGQGNMPKNGFERQIFQAMKLVPGDNDKYARVIREDLVRTQTGIKERFREAVARSGKFLPTMEKIFAEQGLPRELARLPFVESSFDYRVVSSAGAMGLWQFMKSTGKEFGMKITPVVDERRDPLIATRAAAQYLKSAYRRLDSWPAALTSYNHGVAGVARKLREFGTNDLFSIIEHPDVRPLGFASNNFYPCFLAALAVYHDAEKLFPGISMHPPLLFQEKRFGKELKAQDLIRLTGRSIEDLRETNYALDSKVWEGRMKIPAWYAVKLPVGNPHMRASVSTESISQEEIKVFKNEPDVKSVKSKVPAKKIVQKERIKKVEKGKNKENVSQTYIVKKGDTISTIAKKYGTSEKVLKSVNNGVTKLKAGQKILIP